MLDYGTINASILRMTRLMLQVMLVYKGRKTQRLENLRLVSDSYFRTEDCSTHKLKGNTRTRGRTSFMQSTDGGETYSLVSPGAFAAWKLHSRWYCSLALSSLLSLFACSLFSPSQIVNGCVHRSMRQGVILLFEKKTSKIVYGFTSQNSARHQQC